MRRIIFIVTFLSLAFTVSADIFDRPAEVNLVVDSANAFNPEQTQALRAKLDSFELATTVQIQIFTTNDLYGYDILDFAQRLGEGWGVGQKGADNGIVFVYKPKTDSTSGEVTIQIGYGIEPILPDAVCKRIIDREMIPCFRENLVYEGFDKAVDVCISIVKGEFKAEDYGNDSIGGFWSWVLDHLALSLVLGMVGFWVIIFLIIGIYLLCTGGGGGDSYSISTSTGHSSGSSYRSHSSGSHKSYGGGHFGGGGARGKW